VNDKQFQHLLALAKNRLDSHKECQDETSMRLAAFACGRVVGYYMANGSPAEWSAEIDLLQITSGDVVGPM
jgi:hypothetical protein